MAATFIKFAGGAVMAKFTKSNGAEVSAPLMTASVLACGFMAVGLPESLAETQPKSTHEEAARQEGAVSAEGEAEDARRFDIDSYAVYGNTVLAPAEIQRALMPYTGLDKTLDDVLAARDALQTLYREEGYPAVFVNVPPQRGWTGKVRFDVEEQRIGRVRVTGADYYLPSDVEASVPAAAEGEILHLPSLREDLSLANARQGRRISPAIRPGVAPGTINIDLEVDDERPWGAFVELNDQYNDSTERLRLAAGVNYNNLFQAGHSANVLFQTSPQDFDQIQVVSGSYFFPIPGTLANVVLYGVSSNTDIATIGGATVVGDGLTLGGRFVLPLSEQGDAFIQTLLVGADYKDFGDEITLETQGRELSDEFPVAYLPFTVQYRAVSVGERAQTTMSLGMTAGTDVFVARQEEFARKRSGADADFIYLFGSLGHERALSDALNLTTSVDWQYAPDPLISNEQFTLGGVQSVRGYRQAEVLGDRGVRASLQLTWRFDGFENIGAIDNLSAFGFVEGGYVSVTDPLPEQQKSFSLGSVGFGAEVGFLRLLKARADLAYLIENAPEDAPEGGEDITVDADLESSVRIHFSLRAEY